MSRSNQTDCSCAWGHGSIQFPFSLSTCLPFCLSEASAEMVCRQVTNGVYSQPDLRFGHVVYIGPADRRVAMQKRTGAHRPVAGPVNIVLLTPANVCVCVCLLVEWHLMAASHTTNLPSPGWQGTILFTCPVLI